MSVLAESKETRKERLIMTKKKKEPKTVHLGIRKKTTLFFWCLLIISLSFGIYKNFTAINRHTFHEQKIIQTKIVDTSAITSFVSNFAQEYFSWEPKKDLLEKRSNNLNTYLTKELVSLNTDRIRSDIPTKSTAENIQIWSINQDQSDATNYHVLFSVTQRIEEGQDKKKTQKIIHSGFKVTVHLDSKNNLVITQNPTISSLPTKSTFEPKQLENDGTIDAKESEEIQKFLTTFFKIYPTAKESELVYYVKDSSVKAIGKDYVFSELIDPIFTKTGNQIMVHLGVRYLDKETKAVQISQFDLVVGKEDGNWKIAVLN